jgi:hypothetical protein
MNILKAAESYMSFLEAKGIAPSGGTERESGLVLGCALPAGEWWEDESWRLSKYNLLGHVVFSGLTKIPKRLEKLLMKDLDLR